MKKKVVYVVKSTNDIPLYNFAANRHLFKTFKSCGSEGRFYMSMSPVLKFYETDCSPMPGKFDNIPT